MKGLLALMVPGHPPTLQCLAPDNVGFYGRCYCVYRSSLGSVTLGLKLKASLGADPALTLGGESAGCRIADEI